MHAGVLNQYCHSGNGDHDIANGVVQRRLYFGIVHPVILRPNLEKTSLILLKVCTNSDDDNTLPQRRNASLYRGGYRRCFSRAIISRIGACEQVFDNRLEVGFCQLAVKNILSLADAQRRFPRQKRFRAQFPERTRLTEATGCRWPR